jgi:hypothetical protein
MNPKRFARLLAIAAIAQVLLSVSSSSSPQTYHTWGVCTPLSTSTTAPPAGSCDSPCPTGSCSPACNDLVYTGGGCAGEEPECSLELVQHLKSSICRACACNNDPIDPRCISDGTIFRTGDITQWDCYN